MTPADMAALHARCFETPRPWTTVEITATLARPGAFPVVVDHGFALGQVAGTEAELLTLAVAPEARRQGHARTLMHAYHDQARALGAEDAFLEVAEDNAAARGLYAALGYTEAGRRKRYYRTAAGAYVDALVLRCTLRVS